MNAAKKTRRGMRLFALALALAMLMGAAGGVVSAAPIPPAGENGYVSLHTYISKTDDPSIIKVTHTVSAKILIAPKKVVFVLDDSGSMIFGGAGREWQVMAPVIAPEAADTYNAAGYTIGGTYLPVGSRPGGTNHGSIYYPDNTGVSTLAYKNRWKTMVEDAVPAALHAMWGGNAAVAEKIDVAIVTFGDTGAVIKTTGGFVDFNGTHTVAPSGTGTVPWGSATGAGSGYTNLKNWISASNCALGGTEIADGLNGAISLLSSGMGAGDEVYVLALTDGDDYSPAGAVTAAVTTLKTTYNAEIWAVTLNNPSAGIHSFMDGIASSPALSYKPYTQEAAAKVFDDFGEEVKGASGVVAGIKPNTTAYDIVQVPGKPLYELKQSDGDMTMTATLNSGRFDWHWAGELKDGVLYSLSYYLQAKDGTPDGLYHDILASSSFSYNYVDASGIPQDVSIKFPTAYHAPNTGETKEEGAGGNSALNSGASGDAVGAGGSGSAIGTGSGGQQHQENREMANSGFQSVFASGGEDISPDIQSVEASTDSNGRSKLSVELSNGSKMRYQWQFKNAIGEWEDIFGANGSHYTLGKQFVNGKEYELRCKITNPAGSIFFSDVVTVTMEKGSGSLQSRSGEVNIVGENVADAGEEIPVANTATNGMLPGIVAALAAMTLLALLAVAVKRRAGR